MRQKEEQNSGEGWTKEEEEFIRDNYYIMTNQDIAKELGRSKHAIESHVSRYMDISKSNCKQVVKGRLNLNKTNISLSKSVKGYIAGVIDSDGRVGINKTIGRGYISLQPRIGIINTSRNLLESIKSEIGCGSIRLCGRKGKDSRGIKRTKDGYIFEVCSYGGIYRLLNEIGDYLILKKKQGKLLKRFVESRLTPHPECSEKYTQEEQDLYEKIKELNGR